VTRSVILDVDTGIDDAMAILFAVRHPAIDVKAITCVSGNVPVDQVVSNTLAVLDLANAPAIPVAAGAVRPLIEPARHASWVHGSNGLAGIALSPSSRRRSRLQAVELMYQTLTAASQPLTIIALAPLTNLALLLHTYPHAADHIAHVCFMGGSTSVGNATAVAEFNIWHDPEAAYMVLHSGVPLTMYGLDVFQLIAASDQTIAALRASGHPVEQFVGGLLGFELTDPASGTVFTNTVLGDAGTVCAVVAPELFTFRTFPVQVNLSPGLSRGQTIVDRRARRGMDTVHDPQYRPWPTVQVAVEVPAPDAVLNLFLDTIRR
jgi:pyrimidine-specific ribonucleoside hydrolase